MRNKHHVFSPEDISETSSDVKSVLSKIFRTLIHCAGINPIQRWNERMDAYIKDLNKATPLSPKAMGYTRGNIKSELMNPKMSWPVFCKGMVFSRFKKIKIIIIATDEDDQNFYTQETVNLINDDDDQYSVDRFNLPVGGVSSDETNQWLSKIIDRNTKRK